MFADLDTDPEIWPEVKTKLNDMIGEVDLSMVQITALSIAYDQVEIARVVVKAKELGAHITQGQELRVEKSLL